MNDIPEPSLASEVLKEEGFVMPSKPESAPALTNETARAWLIQHVADRFSLEVAIAKSKVEANQAERNAKIKSHLLDRLESLPKEISDHYVREAKTIDDEDSSAWLANLIRTGQREFYLEGHQLRDRWT